MNRGSVHLVIVLSLLLLWLTAVVSDEFVTFGLIFSQPTTPIQHIVIIMQENHSFDSYFGTFPGLNPTFSENLTVCEPVNVTNPSQGCIKPFSADSYSTKFQWNNPYHNWAASHIAYNNGAYNGFVYAQVVLNLKNSDLKNNASYAMGYLTNASIPNYWDYASYYALNANFFSSVLSYTYPNHLFQVAAQAQAKCATTQCAPQFNLAFQTIVQSLNASGIDWKYYAGDWNDSLRCQKIIPKQLNGYNAFVNVLPDFPAIQLSSSTCNRIQNQNDLQADLTSGYLPQVAWIVPSHKVSEHPGGDSSLKNGQLYVTSIVDQISLNPALWSSTAIFLTWDDFGGYYDHMVPQEIDSFGFGPRVPLIVISPYVKHGISYGQGPLNGQEDFSAFLSTIEANWNLAPITFRDQLESPLWYMFDFSQTPLQPLIMSTTSLATYPLSSCKTCVYGIASTIRPPVTLGLISDSSNGTLPTANDEGDPYD